MHTFTAEMPAAHGRPAGTVLGLLPARTGLDFTALDKHGEFLPDFRGDTVHSSALGLLNGTQGLLRRSGNWLARKDGVGSQLTHAFG
ncbi:MULTISPECIES: hypothetical protein [unclassified Streptomyces]|uniref:hypothetical protein n=1 Tax=unclassified Streptomyces TaxID=2593676 RepID=UPI002B1D928D|nr:MULTISPECIES: hypothetical protein [unclassified Streptomyces]